MSAPLLATPIPLLSLKHPERFPIRKLASHNQGEEPSWRVRPFPQDPCPNSIKWKNPHSLGPKLPLGSKLRFKKTSAFRSIFSRSRRRTWTFSFMTSIIRCEGPREESTRAKMHSDRILYSLRVLRIDSLQEKNRKIQDKRLLTLWIEELSKMASLPLACKIPEAKV